MSFRIGPQRETITNNDRTVGLTPATYHRAFGQEVDTGVKYKIIQLIASVRTVMRVPLIIINTLIIVYELVLG